MKLLFFFLLLLITLNAQSKLSFNFSLGKENYDPYIEKSLIIPSIGLEYELVIDSFLIMALKADYENHSVYLNNKVVSYYGTLAEGYYDAKYLVIGPQLGFKLLEDYSFKAGLGFHFLKSQNVKYFENEENGAIVFRDGYGSFNFTIDKQFKTSPLDFTLGIKYERKIKSSVVIPLNRNYEKPQSAFRINLGIILF